MNVHPIHKFLVRRRTASILVITLCLYAAAFKWGHRNIETYLIGLALTIAGEAIRFWAAGVIHKDNTIAQNGPYAIVRNPLYFGSLLIAVGYAIMSGLGPIAWLVIFTLFLVFHLAAILYEETFLSEKFGESYERYKAHVPRLLPNGHVAPDAFRGLTFSWEQVRHNREPTTALVTLAICALFAILFVVR